MIQSSLTFEGGVRLKARHRCNKTRHEVPVSGLQPETTILRHGLPLAIRSYKALASVGANLNEVKNRDIVEFTELVGHGLPAAIRSYR